MSHSLSSQAGTVSVNQTNMENFKDLCTHVLILGDIRHKQRAGALDDESLADRMESSLKAMEAYCKLHGCADPHLCACTCFDPAVKSRIDDVVRHVQDLIQHGENGQVLPDFEKSFYNMGLKWIGYLNPEKGLLDRLDACKLAPADVSWGKNRF